MTAATLGALLEAQAATLDGVAILDVAAGREVRAVGAPVAVIGPGWIEVGLHPAVAAAALRTPDVTPSTRAPGWVHFEPTVVDNFARDRAIAWLESAVRRVVEDGGAD
jgi:hypothetical protein